MPVCVSYVRQVKLSRLLPFVFVFSFYIYNLLYTCMLLLFLSNFSLFLRFLPPSGSCFLPSLALPLSLHAGNFLFSPLSPFHWFSSFLFTPLSHSSLSQKCLFPSFQSLYHPFALLLPLSHTVMFSITTSELLPPSVTCLTPLCSSFARFLILLIFFHTVSPFCCLPLHLLLLLPGLLFANSAHNVPIVSVLPPQKAEKQDFLFNIMGDCTHITHTEPHSHTYSQTVPA